MRSFRRLTWPLLAVGLLVPTAAVWVAADDSKSRLVARADRVANDTVGFAPSLGTASLSISDQFHMANGSAFFKNDQLFLWDDVPTGNLALGRQAMSLASGTATSNTAFGQAALRNTSAGADASNGSANSAFGYQALEANTIGFGNTGLGNRSLFYNVSGDNNTAVGFEALRANSTGGGNAAVGLQALVANTDGDNNTAVGTSAMFGNTSGYFNTALGGGALQSNISGSENVAVGFLAGSVAPNDASDNIFIGNPGDAGDSSPTTRIGIEGVQTQAFMAGIDGNAVLGSAVSVAVSGELGVAPSSRRFKLEIEDLDQVEGGVLALRPVTFRYDPEQVSNGGALEIGLIAEEVAEVFPELVSRDDQGRPFTVRYDLLSVVLLDLLQSQGERAVLRDARLAALELRLARLEGD